MTKKRISPTDLIWIFHEKLREFGSHPQQGFVLAVVPEGRGKWRVVTPRNVLTRSAPWAERIDSIEKRLQKLYVLADK